MGTADTRSQAQKPRSGKSFAAGLLSRRTTLKRLGFTDDEVDAELAEAERDARLGADIRLGRYVTDLAAQ